MRKQIIAGNWKMNKTPSEAAVLAKELAAKCDGADADVVFCVPAIDIFPALDAVKGTSVKIGAQNIHFEESGAYTGETSAAMLLDLGIEYVIIGHSERREYFAETDATVNKKVLKALASGLIPIVCVGERLTEREQGVTMDLVRLQTKIAFQGVSADDAAKVVVAYEPIWAIGTGKTATSEQAEEVCAGIRQVLGELYGGCVAEKIRIQYGGSVTAANAKELFSMPNIDGGLVGGASLKPDFGSIVKY